MTEKLSRKEKIFYSKHEISPEYVIWGMTLRLSLA